MVAIAIDHRQSAKAACVECQQSWATCRLMTVARVLALAAEHAEITGHTVNEWVSDDITVRATGEAA